MAASRLAFRTKIGGSLSLNHFFNWFGTNRTGTFYAVDIELLAEVARATVYLSKVLQGSASLQYSRMQGLLDGLNQAVEAFLADPTR